MAAAVVGAGSRLRLWLRVPVQPGLRLPVDWSLCSLFIATTVLPLGLLTLWSAWTLGALVSLPVALAEPFFYEARVYHLGLPWQALLERGLRAHPENPFAAFPPLAQLLSLAPLAVGLDRVPAMLHW